MSSADDNQSTTVLGIIELLLASAASQSDCGDCVEYFDGGTELDLQDGGQVILQRGSVDYNQHKCWLLQRLKKMVMNHWWLVMLRTSIVNLKYCESESEIYLKQKIWPGLMTKVLPRQSPLPEACLRPPCIYLIVDNIYWEDQHIITCKIDLGSSSTMERSTKCD